MRSLNLWAIITTILALTVIITSCVFAANMETATEKQNETPTETETERPELTTEERELWAKVLFCEGATLNDEACAAQASVMFNHIGVYGDNITEVLTRPNAFYGYNAIKKAEGQDLSRYYRIVDEIWANGPTVPSNVVLFGFETTFTIFGEAVELYAVVDGVWFFSFAEGYH